MPVLLQDIADLLSISGDIPHDLLSYVSLLSTAAQRYIVGGKEAQGNDKNDEKVDKQAPEQRMFPKERGASIHSLSVL